jgi:hypothetical protein
MKVKAKQLLFSSLPNAKKGKKLPKAQPGKRLGETGMAPIGIPDDYFDKFIKPTQVQDPVDLTPAPDTSKIKLPQVPTVPPGYQPPQERRPSLGNKGLNPGQAALLGLAAFDAVLPDWYPKYTPAQPQVGYNPNLYGTGSQAIAQSGTQVAYRRDIAPMPNPSRGRTNPPIYTQDPNDPRIQPYRDSLTLHNYSNKAAELSKRESIPIKEWEALVDGVNPEVVRSAYKRLGGPDDIGRVPINVVIGDKNKEVEAYARLYKKPVQPVIYRPRRPVVASDVQDIVPIDRPISVEGGGFKPTDLSQKPTKYSATIRDESAPGQQRTVYFKTKKEWQNFKDSGAVNVASSAETADSATAAGYRAMQTGGSVQPIYTDNPNDPRLINYRDSLDLYNLYRAQAQGFGEGPNIPGYADSQTSIATQIGDYARAIQKRVRPKGYSALTAAFGDNPIRQRDYEAYERRTGQPVAPDATAPSSYEIEFMKSNTNPNIYFPYRSRLLYGWQQGGSEL